ncbi:hypothetical protein BD408DRAFT_421442 [Parasitella parasitica]|nr:hypothetical protein BD408DRAFT_421442 [Parasitella parasitica]
MLEEVEQLAEEYKNMLKKHSWIGLEEYADDPPPSKIRTKIFGLVMSISPVFQPSGNAQDWRITIGIFDPTLPMVHGKQNSFTCIFFKYSEANLPNLKIDDIVLLRNVAVQGFRANKDSKSKSQYVSDKESQFVVFSKEMGDGVEQEELAEEEKELFQALKAWRDAKAKYIQTLAGSSGQPVSFTARPLLTTEKIIDDDSRYFNYVGMIVGCFDKLQTPKGSYTRTLKLTDFTQNPHPYIRKDSQFADEGTVGIVSPDMMLQCTLWDNHAHNCPELEYGDYVLLDNCNRNSNNASKKYLEISIRSNNDQRQYVVKLSKNDSRLKPLLQRKAQLEAMLERENSSEIAVVQHRIRTRDIHEKQTIPVRELIEMESEGTEYVRVTIAQYKPLDCKSWLRDYCQKCKRTFKSTIAEQCEVCSSLLKPVYQVGFMLEDKEGSKLVAWVFDEAADRLFYQYPAQRLKDEPSLWPEFEQYMTLGHHQENKPYFTFGIKKYYYSLGTFIDGWNYCIVNSELIFEDD